MGIMILVSGLLFLMMVLVLFSVVRFLWNYRLLVFSGL